MYSGTNQFVGNRGRGRGGIFRGRGSRGRGFFRPNFSPPQQFFPPTPTIKPRIIEYAELPCHILSEKTCAQIRQEQIILDKRLEKKRRIAVEAMKLAQQREDYLRQTVEFSDVNETKENTPPAVVAEVNPDAKKVGNEGTRRVLFDGADTNAGLDDYPEQKALRLPRAIVKTNQFGSLSTDFLNSLRCLSVDDGKKTIRYTKEELMELNPYKNRVRLQ